MDKYFLGLYGKAKEVAETIWKKSKLSIVDILDFITSYMALWYCWRDLHIEQWTRIKRPEIYLHKQARWFLSKVKI